jgi:hypothetical protein
MSMSLHSVETLRRHAAATLSRRSSLAALGGAALAAGLFAPWRTGATDDEGKQQCQGHHEECEAAVREVCSGEGVPEADCLAAVSPCCAFFANGNVGDGLRCFFRQWLTPIAMDGSPVPSQASPVPASTPEMETGTVTIRVFC